MSPAKLCEIEQIKKDYIANDGVECPNPECRSDTFTGGFVEINRGQAYQNCYCEDCGWEWTDTYKLTNMELG